MLLGYVLLKSKNSGVWELETTEVLISSAKLTLRRYHFDYKIIWAQHLVLELVFTLQYNIELNINIYSILKDIHNQTINHNNI